jgi:fatty acid-binding protein DegV
MGPSRIGKVFETVFSLEPIWVIISALQLEVLLVALGRKAECAIKKLVQQAQQFHFAVNFDWATSEALPLQEFPEMFLVTATAQQKSERATP